jgi:hypothetical protein
MANPTLTQGDHRETQYVKVVLKASPANNYKNETVKVPVKPPTVEFVFLLCGNE